MDYKAMAETIYEFLLLVDNVDPYRDNAGKFDRVIRGVIMAYSHDVRRTESATEQEQLNDLERAYKTYKTSDLDNVVINIYNVVKAYHVLTWYNPSVSYKWAIESIYEHDNNR